MPKLDTYPAAIRDALAVHELLRRLGMPADAIFFQPNKPPKPLQVILRTQGLVFAVDCGQLPEISSLAYTVLCAEAAACYNEAPGPECQAVLDGSELFKRAPEMIVLLAAKGFVLGHEAAAWARA